MFRPIFTIVLTIGSLAWPASAKESWDHQNGVSVIWNNPRGIAKIRFNSLDNYAPRSGCSKRPVEIVTVLSSQLHTPNGADDLFRGRSSQGRVDSYRILLDDLSKVTLNWLEEMLQEGRRVRIYSGKCGNAGYIYVDQIDALK